MLLVNISQEVWEPVMQNLQTFMSVARSIEFLPDPMPGEEGPFMEVNGTSTPGPSFTKTTKCRKTLPFP